MQDLRAANVEFFEKIEGAFRELFDAARAKNELHFALALMRGMQDAGWSTAEEAHRAFDEYSELVEKATGPIRLTESVNGIRKRTREDQQPWAGLQAQGGSAE